MVTRPLARFPRTIPMPRVAAAVSLCCLVIIALGCGGATGSRSIYEGDWSNTQGEDASYHDLHVTKAGDGYRVRIDATAADDGSEHELSFDASDGGDALTFIAAEDPDTETATITASGDTLTLNWYGDTLTFARD